MAFPTDDDTEQRQRGGEGQGSGDVTVRSGESQHAQPDPQPSGGAAGPHNTPDQVNKHSTPGTGMLTPPGKADDDDMAPSG
jgi:hypothetical protein